MTDIIELIKFKKPKDTYQKYQNHWLVIDDKFFAFDVIKIKKEYFDTLDFYQNQIEEFSEYHGTEYKEYVKKLQEISELYYNNIQGDTTEYLNYNELKSLFASVRLDINDLLTPTTLTNCYLFDVTELGKNYLNYKASEYSKEYVYETEYSRWYLKTIAGSYYFKNDGDNMILIDTDGNATEIITPIYISGTNHVDFHSCEQMICNNYTCLTPTKSTNENLDEIFMRVEGRLSTLVFDSNDVLETWHNNHKFLSKILKDIVTYKLTSVVLSTKESKFLRI